MGANIVFEMSACGGEPVADLHVKVAPERRRGAARARALDDRRISDPRGRGVLREGTTRMLGLAELRAKKAIDCRASPPARRERASDTRWARTLSSCTRRRAGRGLVKTHLDHRIAMSFLVLGLGAKEPGRGR